MFMQRWVGPSLVEWERSANNHTKYTFVNTIHLSSNVYAEVGWAQPRRVGEKCEQSNKVYIRQYIFLTIYRYGHSPLDNALRFSHHDIISDLVKTGAHLTASKTSIGLMMCR